MENTKYSASEKFQIFFRKKTISLSKEPKIWTPRQTMGNIEFQEAFQRKACEIFIPRKAGYCNHLRVSVCLFVCLFVSRISQKRLVGFWWNLVSREVMIIGRPSSKLGVIRIEIRIWDPDNCLSLTTGRIFGSGFQSDPG